MKVKDILAAAKKEVGVKESPPNSNNVKYNTWYYGREVHDHDINPTITYPWCCVHVVWLYRSEPNLIKKTASCSDLMRWCQANGLIVTDPQPGDWVFMKFSNKKDVLAEHIGLVIDNSTWAIQKKLRTHEGNTSVTSNDNGGCVMERVRAKSVIVGFARPAYSDAAAPTKATNTINVANKPTLKIGDKGDWVKVAQARLLVNGYQLEVDGDFGPITKNAVIAFQASYGLVKDGIIGPKTWAKLYPM